MPAPTSSFTVSNQCPTLRGVCDNPSILSDFQPHDLRALADDAAWVLQRCSLDEITRSPDQLEEDEALMSALGTVEPLLRQQKGTGTVLIMAFRKALLTASNLQALLLMCDSTHRTGKVRCLALHFFFGLGNDRDMWNFDASTNAQNFSLELIRVLAKGLVDDRAAQSTGTHPNRHLHGNTCNCRVRWEFLDRALVTSQSDPNDILQQVVTIDWRNLFKERNVPPSTADFAERYFAASDMDVFTTLHLTAVRVLESDPTHTASRSFLGVLGGCQKFLRTVMQRTVVPPCDPARAKATTLFLDAFLSCLVAPPTDKQTDRLVRNALSVLGRHLPPSELGLIARWPDLKRESDDDRWNRFEEQYLANDDEESEAREEGEGVGGTSEAPRPPISDVTSPPTTVCAPPASSACDNCRLLESDLPKGTLLLRCARCRGAAYCGKACQVEHWRQSHKQVCHAIPS